MNLERSAQDLMLQYKKDIMLLESVQSRAIKVVKGLKDAT